jgi:hypothetical protein
MTVSNVQTIHDVSRAVTRPDWRELHLMTSYRFHTGIIQRRTAKRSRENEAKSNVVLSKRYAAIIEVIFAVEIFLAGAFVSTMWYV